MANRRFRQSALAWTLLACGLPALAAADDDDQARPDRVQMLRAANDAGVALYTRAGFSRVGGQSVTACAVGMALAERRFGLDDKVDVGPLINEGALDKVGSGGTARLLILRGGNPMWMAFTLP